MLYINFLYEILEKCLFELGVKPGLY